MFKLSQSKIKTGEETVLLINNKDNFELITENNKYDMLNVTKTVADITFKKFQSFVKPPTNLEKE